MKKLVKGVVILLLLACAEEGKKVPEQCIWEGECPQGWKRDGDTCVYEGETVTIGGKVEVYYLGTKVSNAVVKIMDFDELIPPCGVSDQEGNVIIEGIPKGTDVTAVVSVNETQDAFGKPTYYFHFVGGPIKESVSDETFVHINKTLADMFLGILGITKSLEPGHGVIAGLVIEDPIQGKYVEGATVASVPSDDFTKSYYVSKELKTVDKTDSSGTFIIVDVPEGEVKITAYAGEPTAPIGSTSLVVYEGAVSIANILKGRDL